MTLAEYARNVHAANFICGIGRHCIAGQPCVSAAKQDWLVLYSLQQWNFYMNSLYGAIQDAITMVRESAASAVSEFTPIHPVKWMGLTIATGTLAAIVLATVGALLLMPISPLAAVATEGTAVAALEGEAAAATVGGEAVAATVGGETVAAPAAGAALRRRHHKETLSTDKFTAYANLDNDIGTLQLKLNKVISMNINSVLRAPISSDLGVYNVVKNATYLTPNPNRSDLQQSAKKLAQLTMISELFKSLKMFAVVGNGLCIGDGPNGAPAGNEDLAYCNEDKLLMQIVRADGDKMNAEIPNAKLLSQKYGFDTKYLISTAWSCQEKSQARLKAADSPHPTNTTSLAETTNRLNSDCAFTLPVCDTRIPEIRKRLNDHDDVVVACREAGSLDI